ncbi:hypothetical protein FRC15_003301 [Serendipita sp. 397]|nr:hypothetical protein FRC15_003301 [Serendipita sp. 397]
MISLASGTEEPQGSTFRAANVSPNEQPFPPPPVEQTRNDTEGLSRLLQEYSLPVAVASSLTSWTKGANSLAVIMALLAGVQVGLVQLVAQNESLPNDVTTRTLRWFMYAGVLIDLGGTASAIAIVVTSTAAVAAARDKIILEEDSLPHKVLKGDPIPEILLTEERETELLEEFGIPRTFKLLGWHMLISFITGSLFIAISLCIWIWKTESSVIFGTLVPLVLITLSPVFLILAATVQE